MLEASGPDKGTAIFALMSTRPRLGNNRPLPSLARPSLLHGLDREGSKIFVHPLGTRLDVCNGHTRSLSQCHLVWWTNAKEPRRISKPLHKSDAAPRLEHPIDVTRSIVGDESRTCRQHSDPRSRSRLQPRLQPMHSGRPPLRPCTVPAKTSFSPCLWTRRSRRQHGFYGVPPSIRF